MDSQGRKVVVCDNGTGVSAGGEVVASSRGGDVLVARGPSVVRVAPLGPRAARTRGRGAALPAFTGVGSEGTDPILVSPSLPPPRLGVRRWGRPTLEGDPACCPAAAGAAPEWGHFG